MHRYISTDNGLECFACGIVLDYSPDADDLPPSHVWPDPVRNALEDAAGSLAFGLCHPGNDARAHNSTLEGTPADHPYADPRSFRAKTDGYRLVCAYDATTVDALTDPASVNPVCEGA